MTIISKILQIREAGRKLTKGIKLGVLSCFSLNAILHIICVGRKEEIKENWMKLNLSEMLLTKEGYNCR